MLVPITQGYRDAEIGECMDNALWYLVSKMPTIDSFPPCQLEVEGGLPCDDLAQ